jgi:phage FluMu protein Com
LDTKATILRCYRCGKYLCKYSIKGSLILEIKCPRCEAYVILRDTNQ